MAFDEQLAERVRDGFKKVRAPFEEKRMMGGLCFMVRGKMCVGVDKQRLMARVGPDAYESALQKKGCIPMDFTGRPMRGFVFVTLEGFRTETDLQHWLDLALAYNPQAKTANSKPPRRKKS